ncbi:unnamed protein product, partial [Prorocentrum cordatum]
DGDRRDRGAAPRSRSGGPRSAGVPGAGLQASAGAWPGSPPARRGRLAARARARKKRARARTRGCGWPFALEKPAATRATRRWRGGSQEGEEKKDDKDPLEHLAEPSAQYPYGLENPERSLEPSRNALACMTSSCADIGTLGNRPARTTKKISRPFRTMGWKGVARRMSPRVA